MYTTDTLASFIEESVDELNTTWQQYYAANRIRLTVNEFIGGPLSEFFANLRFLDFEVRIREEGDMDDPELRTTYRLTVSSEVSGQKKMFFLFRDPEYDNFWLRKAPDTLLTSGGLGRASGEQLITSVFSGLDQDQETILQKILKDFGLQDYATKKESDYRRLAVKEDLEEMKERLKELPIADLSKWGESYLITLQSGIVIHTDRNGIQFPVSDN